MVYSVLPFIDKKITDAICKLYMEDINMPLVDLYGEGIWNFVFKQRNKFLTSQRLEQEY